MRDTKQKELGESGNTYCCDAIFSAGGMTEMRDECCDIVSVAGRF